MLSSELPALHLSKNLDTLLCGYTQPTVGLARPVLCINSKLEALHHDTSARQHYGMLGLSVVTKMNPNLVLCLIEGYSSNQKQIG